MAVTDPHDIAQSPLPADAGEKYAGRWIAVREGVVVADANSLEELTSDQRVRDDDAVYHVPPPHSAFF
ncbi:MAG TPA: DUF5678 domain-containing protein [Thermoleophilaceae bacterium]|jgi:hypothetical protein